MTKCPDCDYDIKIPDDVEPNEIVVCVCCGLELIYKDGFLIPLELEGEDFGE